MADECLTKRTWLVNVWCKTKLTITPRTDEGQQEMTLDGDSTSYGLILNVLGNGDYCCQNDRLILLRPENNVNFT